MKNKILLVVEGEKTEPKILGSASHGLLSLIGANYEIVSFSNPIYELYDAYINGEYDDLVSYLRVEKGLKIDDKILSKNAFSSIYLVFDYEPHYQKYSDIKIKNMLSLFNDETRNGKLYINYPMVEAYFDIRSFPDYEFNKRMVNLLNFRGKTYKKEINANSIISKSRVNVKDMCYIIMQNYCKAKILSNDENYSYDIILNKQIEEKNLNNRIYVLSTFALFPMDYNLKKTISVLKDKLGNDFYVIDSMKDICV